MDGEEVLAGRPALGGAQPGAWNESGRDGSGRGSEERPRASGRRGRAIAHRNRLQVGDADELRAGPAGAARGANRRSGGPRGVIGKQLQDPESERKRPRSPRTWTPEARRR